MAGFASMKKSRMGFDQLAKKFESDKQGGYSNKDERLFYPKLDENKNGQAVIRFLPPSEGEDTPWVKVYSHGFKGPKGKWYIEECPTTIGKECPLCEANSKLVESHGGWDSTPESDKTIVRKRKRRLQYISNVLIVEDKKNPEREGKVMIFKYGAKIFDKLKSAMYPEFDGEEQINPFDFWEGADFRLRIRKYEGNVNYDKSEFASSSPIAKTDKAIEEIWNQQHKLGEFLFEDRFKPYEDLQRQVVRTLGGSSASTATAQDVSKQATVDAPVVREEEAAPKQKVETPSTSETDEAMDFFRKMAESD